MKFLFILLTTLFADANAQYAEGNYAEAIVQYEQILTEQQAPEVYYNLGNAYFKQGELAQSILAYERALRLKPSYKDAKHNLQFAQLLPLRLTAGGFFYVFRNIYCANLL